MINIKRTLVTLCCTLLTAMTYAYDFEVDGMYYNITSLQNLTVELTNGDNYYTGDVVVPATVEYSNKTFTVTRLGDYVFQSCSDITSIKIPNTVTTTGAYTFSGCSNLTSLTIPSSITEIGNSSVNSDYGRYCFSGCWNLSNIIFSEGTSNTLYLNPNDWYTGSCRPFVDCQLKSIYLGRDIDCYLRDYDEWCNPFYNQTQLTEVTFGPNITNIISRMFVGCSALEHINIPSNVTDINAYAFQDCSSLKDIILNEGLKTISNDAFKNCSKITQILLPSTITRIDNEAFLNCTNIAKVYSKATTPGTLNEGAFPGIVYLSAVLYVPTGTKSLYEAATGWKDFSSIVETDNFDNLTTYYSFNVSTTTGGNVSVLDNTLSNTSLSASVKEGDNVTMTFTPNDGYELKSLTVNGEDVTKSVSNDSYTVPSVNQNTSIVVTFAELPVYLTIKSADNGSIAQESEKGKEYTFVITPSEGWQVESVSFNGTDVTSQMDGSKYTTPAITANSELNIVYKQDGTTSAKSIDMNNDIAVSASYGTLTIQNNGGDTNVSVFSINGALVVSENIGVGTTTFNLPINNIYIVKVGNETYKVSM